VDWISAELPPERALTERYGRIEAALDERDTPAGWRAAFSDWDQLRREWHSGQNLVELRFTQDTGNEQFRAAQQALDARIPGVTAREVRVKRRFLEGGTLRAPLETELGPQAFALWDADVHAFEQGISEGLVRESELSREYTEVLAAASVYFEGQERSLAGLGAFFGHPERALRHAAEVARWSIFESVAEHLDAIFDELVRVRDGMARALGYKNFIELGYRRMHRVDYGPSDVARYRDDVRATVVPVVRDLVQRFGARAGLERVYFWDEKTLGIGARAVPQGERGWIVDRAVESLAALAPSLGEFGAIMKERRLLDVDLRPGKAFGAYCTMFPTHGVPFVFANFNGSSSDITTLMHELGHAFQGYSSRNKAAIDYLTPTLESAEIHSMALEYLSWPEMERFFGSAADTYRREHLRDALFFLPYGVAVDHFQHLVYENPGATPAERHAMWQEMERRYLPWRDYGDLTFPARGRLWQEKRHIFGLPFYYIDYALALCCALQFWALAGNDRARALEAYVALCARGGEAPFGELVRSAGLRSPFGGEALGDVVRTASAAFG
jgi:M3 family oligoendopeptidase